MTERGYYRVTRDESGRRPKKSAKVCSIIKGIMFSIFISLRYYFDLFIDYIFGLIYDNTKQRVKPSNNPLILESATSLAAKIRKREVKVEDVVKAFIDRIKEVNPVINALVDDRFKDALEEAKKLDKEIEIGDITDADFQLKPFLGVPFTNKETTAAKGLSFTFGLYARQNKKAAEDAEIVKLLKEAGGILLGVTNVPQLNMWQETFNPLFGVTKNPYNSTRNVGGSSGGEASLLAAGGSPLGLGTDIGGSLRIPAFMCGIFGHKPTCDIINTRGMTYRSGKEKDSMVVAGPMTRYAEDIIPLLKVLSGENAEKLNLNKKADIKDLKIYYVEDPQDPFISKTRPEMTKVFKNVINYFDEISPVKPQKLELPGLRYGGKLWRYWMTQEEGYNFNRDITDRQGQVKPLWEIVKYIFCSRTFSISTVFNMVNSLLPREKEQWARKESKQLKEQILNALGDNGVLIYPSAPWPASYHYTAFFRPWNFNLFSIWNAMKLPVTQVPLGLGSEGLPVGIQVVTAPYQDRLGIAVAAALEKQFGGYVPPFKTEE